MKKYVLIIISVLIPVITFAQNPERVSDNDSSYVGVSAPKMIPMILPAEWFIPDSRLEGITPWKGSPIARPVVFVIPQDGLPGLLAAGAYSHAHPDKFFSTFNGNNMIDVPQLFLAQEKFLGNTLRLGKKNRFYFVSGILYGAQMGVRGNNWGMGTREGILWRPAENISVFIWNQYFQSVLVYTPVIFPTEDGSTAAILMPATPEVFSFGVQASFTVGEFIIGVGTSIAPVPFQNR